MRLTEPLLSQFLEVEGLAVHDGTGLLTRPIHPGT